MRHLSTTRSFGSARVRTPIAVRGMRIGVMGGSFNPPHDGHRLVAATAMKRLGLDAVWWLVTPGNPLKQNSGLAPLIDRMRACRDIADHPRMPITAFEAELGAPYTAVTLEFLTRRYPGVRFVWLMGADNLASFHRWQNWRAIAASTPIAVVDRPGWRLAANASVAARVMAKHRVREDHARLIVSRRRQTRRTCSRGHPAWVFLSARLSATSSTALRSQR